MPNPCERDLAIDGPLPQRYPMHPEALRRLSQAQQFHIDEIRHDQYGSLSDTLSLLDDVAAQPARRTGHEEH
jgi:hypothetical protein